MIYIIDDKKSRQKDYGWDEKRLSSFSQLLMPIWDVEALNISQEKIIQDGSIILFHESFPQSDDFKKKLDDLSSNLNIAYFSGSKGARFVSNNRCMLPPDVLYINLELFINKCQENDFNFKYLAFGENYVLEEQLRNRIIDINNQNTGAEKILCNKNLFFAATSDDELEVEPPFDMLVPEKDWDIDFKEKDITDLDLDKFINDYLANKHYDSIYIPLCFGSVLSDFIGLRLAMHIRLTPTINATTPIFIYGEAKFDELKSHYCFDILKTSAVKLIKSDSASFIDAYQSMSLICDLEEDLKLIHLELPSNIGQHSLANQWGADVLARLVGIEYEPNESILKARKSLYFKYVLAKNSQDDSQIDVKEKINAKGKKILLIDDEANKGWSRCLKSIFLNCPEENFDVVENGISEYKDLPEDIKIKIEKDHYDLYLLDLRLLGSTEEDNVMTRQFSGYRLLSSILKKNKGNQVIIMTASNKAWNIKNLISEGANGYYIKEAPEQMLPLQFSIENYTSLKKDVERAFEDDFKRVLFKQIEYLQGNIKKSRKLREKGVNIDLISVLREQFIPFMIKISSKEDFVSSFLILFSVFEVIRNYYRTDVNKSERDPIANVITAVYEQIGRGDNIWPEVEELVEARNDYIHPKKGKKPAEFIYSKDGLLKLFNVISKIIKSLM